MTDPSTRAPDAHGQEDLARRAVGCSWWNWSLPWCSLPDKHGRVWRRNWSPGDPGFGWSQVSGRILREPRHADGCLPDFRDPGSAGCLLALVREAWGAPLLSCRHSVTLGAWVVEDPGGVFVRVVASAPTEIEALVCALEAAHQAASARREEKP